MIRRLPAWAFLTYILISRLLPCNPAVKTKLRNFTINHQVTFVFSKKKKKNTERKMGPFRYSTSLVRFSLGPSLLQVNSNTLHFDEIIITYYLQCPRHRRIIGGSWRSRGQILEKPGFLSGNKSFRSLKNAAYFHGLW